MSANADKKQSDKYGADGELVSPQTSQISHLEEKGQNIPIVDNTDQDEEFSHTEQRKIVHRIDRRLIIVLGLMYCVSLIDRGNMPNAAIAGMHDDLGTNIGYRYVSVKSRSLSCLSAYVGDSNAQSIDSLSPLWSSSPHILCFNLLPPWSLASWVRGTFYPLFVSPGVSSW